jgi:hypothetical protein
MSMGLFSLTSDDVAVTSDDCYTPKWLFDAMGLQFDVDVAAPSGGPWHVPCKKFYTAVDDGLTQPWDGLVWCNPPYSNYLPWAQRWITHEKGVLLGYQLPQVRWTKEVFAAANVVAFTGAEFLRPNARRYRLRQPVFLAFRGVGTEPAERVAAADPYGAILYGVGQVTA